jgi:hypothetical protein
MLHVMVAAATAWIFIAFAAVFACVATAAAARAQGRRLERRMVAELGRRWDQRMQNVPLIAPESPSSAAAGATPAGSDAGRAPAADPDLRITLEDLLTQRDLLLEEFQEVQAQISVLKKRVERRKPIAAVADDDDENVVRLHDVLPEEWAERRRR